MNLSLKIAFRYLFSFRKFHFITFITIISVFGIVIGVAALIIVMSIFNGFGKFTEDQLIGYDPHIRILPKSGMWIENYTEIEKGLSTRNNLEGYSPVIDGRMIITKDNNMKVVHLFGYDVFKFSGVSGINNTIIDGSFRIVKWNDKNQIVIGSGLAYSLNAQSGETVQVMSFKDVESSITSLYKQPGMLMQISGIFLTNNPEYDDTYGYTSIKNAAKLLRAPFGAVSAVDVRLKSLEDTEYMKKVFEERFPDYQILTWFDLHKELYTILKFERMAVFIVLSLIIIIAVFNVLASLSMTVVEKRSDISVLKALGANNKFIRNLYLYLGLFIGLISTTIGTILGLGLSYGQIFFEWIKLNSAQYLIKSLPVVVSWIDVVLIITVSLILSFLATIYPSKRAASTNIIESIREE